MFRRTTIFFNYPSGYHALPYFGSSSSALHLFVFFFSLLMCANRNWFYRATFGSDVVSIANVYCFLFRCSLVGLATKRCLFPFFISSFSVQEKFINFAVFGMIYSTVFCFRLNLKVFENARLKMHTLSYR